MTHASTSFSSATRRPGSTPKASLERRAMPRSPSAGARPTVAALRSRRAPTAVPGDRDALAPEGSGDPRFRGRQPRPCPHRSRRAPSGGPPRATRTPRRRGGAAQVRRLAAERERADVGQPVERREQRDHLVEAAVERGGLGRPARRDDAVPERLGVVGVVEEPAVAEVAAARATASAARAPRGARACGRARGRRSERRPRPNHTRIDRRVALSWRAPRTRWRTPHASHPSRLASAVGRLDPACRLFRRRRRPRTPPAATSGGATAPRPRDLHGARRPAPRPMSTRRSAATRGAR